MTSSAPKELLKVLARIKEGDSPHACRSNGRDSPATSRTVLLTSINTHHSNATRPRERGRRKARQALAARRAERLDPELGGERRLRNTLIEDLVRPTIFEMQRVIGGRRRRDLSKKVSVRPSGAEILELKTTIQRYGRPSLTASSLRVSRSRARGRYRRKARQAAAVTKSKSVASGRTSPTNVT